MNEDEARLMELESERNAWRQVLAQTDEAMAAHADGWASEDAYAEVAVLRDQCRAEIGRVEAEIAELIGDEPPVGPEKVGVAMPERVAGSEDALIELANLAASNEVTLDDVVTGMMELAELVGGVTNG